MLNNVFNTLRIKKVHDTLRSSDLGQATKGAYHNIIPSASYFIYIYYIYSGSCPPSHQPSFHMFIGPQT